MQLPCPDPAAVNIFHGTGDFLVVKVNSPSRLCQCRSHTPSH